MSGSQRDTGTPIRFKDEYDWIVLGDHPGALLSGMLAARLGLSVLILPLGEAAWAARATAEAVIDPEPNWWTGLTSAEGEPGLLARCLERASTKFNFVPAEELQCLMPGHRVEIGLDSEVFRNAAVRECPSDRESIESFARALKGVGPEIRKFWAELPERLTLPPENQSRGTRIKTKSRLFMTRRFPNLQAAAKKALQEKKLLKKDRRWLTWSASKQATPFLSQLLLGLRGSSFHLDPFQGAAVMQSAAWYRGGATQLRRDLIQAAQDLGATYAQGLACRAIFLEEGKFLGVQVADRGTMIAGKGLALGCGLDQAREYVSTGTKRSFRRRLKKAPEPTGWCFTLSLWVREAGVPAGMGSHLVWQDPGAPPLVIEQVDPADYGLQPEGRRLIFLRTYLPFTQETLGVGYQRRVASRMLRQFVEIAPFVEYHLLKAYPDFRGDGSELSEVSGFPSLALVPESLRRYSGKGLGVDTGVQGVYLVNGEAFPELGTLGPTVAAVQAVSDIAHQNGLAGPFSE